MNRRDFLGSAAALAAGANLPETALANPSDIEPKQSRVSRSRDSLTIRDYLTQEARRITANALKDFKDESDWKRLIAEKRLQFIDMMGLSDRFTADRPTVPVHVTGVLERPTYRIEKLYYESLPNLFVTANLYIPTDSKARIHNSKSPAVLYVCGHAENQKVHYQAHPRRFAELGFVTLIVETVQLGEARGFHHGPYREGWFHWYSRGYTPAGIELWNGIRGLDLLAARTDVDSSKLGVTGISGGGASTWWIAAADERIKCASPVCGTATLESHLAEKTIDGHCDCMWWTNTERWDLADVGGLIAPRPLMIASADRDEIFTIASIRKVHEQLQGLYGKLGAAANLRLVETPGPHSYHERSRTAIFSWFLKHLAGRDISPSRVGNVDESPTKQESLADLKVYSMGEPPGNRTPTVHDELIALPTPPRVTTQAELESERSRVVHELRRKSFGAFPTKPVPLDTQIEFEFERNGGTGFRFGFTSEEGWRLHGQLVPPGPDGAAVPAVIGLRTVGEERASAESLLGRIRAPWAKVVVEVRGTGDSAWGEELQWHVRRAAAWTGRTLASMRVWDTLRAIQAVRGMKQVDSGKIALAAREEMAAVALYAALLDGRISAIFLESPPPSQNLPGDKSGRGQSIEMLNCLRITDLPQVAGLLCPAELALATDQPDLFRWAEETYAALGHKTRFHRSASLTSWTPA